MGDGPDYAALVCALLADQGVSAYELARRAGLTQQAVLDITKGKRPNPRIDTIRKLLAAAGKPWAWLDRALAGGPAPGARRAKGRGKK